MNLKTAAGGFCHLPIPFQNPLRIRLRSRRSLPRSVGTANLSRRSQHEFDACRKAHQCQDDQQYGCRAKQMIEPKSCDNSHSDSSYKFDYHSPGNMHLTYGSLLFGTIFHFVLQSANSAFQGTGPVAIRQPRHPYPGLRSRFANMRMRPICQASRQCGNVDEKQALCPGNHRFSSLGSQSAIDMQALLTGKCRQLNFIHTCSPSWPNNMINATIVISTPTRIGSGGSALPKANSHRMTHDGVR